MRSCAQKACSALRGSDARQPVHHATQAAGFEQSCIPMTKGPSNSRRLEVSGQRAKCWDHARSIISSATLSGNRRSQTAKTHGQDDNGFRASPTCRSQNPSHTQAARNETQDRRFVQSLLNDAGRVSSAVATAKSLMKFPFSASQSATCGALRPGFLTPVPDRRSNRRCKAPAPDGQCPPTWHNTGCSRTAASRARSRPWC